MPCFLLSISNDYPITWTTDVSELAIRPRLSAHDEEKLIKSMLLDMEQAQAHFWQYSPLLINLPSINSIHLAWFKDFVLMVNNELRFIPCFFFIIVNGRLFTFRCKSRNQKWELRDEIYNQYPNSKKNM